MTIAKSAIEATSLESVKAIAANPPTQPGDHSHTHRYPLILYIAKVPGSRDVFLTPIKPREKVVTAGDVESSLYYVHVNSVYDHEELETRHERQIEREPPNHQWNSGGPHGLQNREAPPPLPVRRPIAQPLLPYPLDDDMLVFAPPSPAKTFGIARKPILPDRRRPLINVSADDLRPPIPSHGHPPRLPPRLPPRPLPSPPADEGEEDDYESYADPPILPQIEEPDVQRTTEARGQGAILTLIRRDPQTNEQWNVATISDARSEAGSQDSFISRHSPIAAKRSRFGSRTGNGSMDLQITNSGYAQFIRDIDSTNSEMTGSRSNINFSTEDPSTSSNRSRSSESTSSTSKIFTRRLYHPSSSSPHSSQTRSSISIPPNTEPRSHSRLNSEASTLSSPLPSHTQRTSIDESQSPFPPQSHHGRRSSKGYIFLSPWGGTCEFRTGPSGRSLYCRQEVTSLGNGISGGKRELSELRFNLPVKGDGGRSGRGSREDGMQEGTGKGWRASYFATHFPRDGSSSGDGDDGLKERGEMGEGMTRRKHVAWVIDRSTGRFDLSLGRERAGGGFGGKKAKLGKLIVEPEGVQMLDLLVAANVGLWWRAYERV